MSTTRNRQALVAALNKMTLKDFQSQDEREQASKLIDMLHAGSPAPTKRSRKAKEAKESKTEKVALTAEAGKGIVKKETTPAPVEDEVSI